MSMHVKNDQTNYMTDQNEILYVLINAKEIVSSSVVKWLIHAAISRFQFEHYR